MPEPLPFPEERNVSGNLSRATLLRGIAVMALANAVMARIFDLASGETWFGAVAAVADRDMVTVLVVLAACGLAGLQGRASQRQIPTMGSADALAVLLAVLIVLVPLKSAGWAALGVFGVYGARAWRATPGPSAAAAILAAVAFYEIGGRMVIGLMGPALMQWDAAAATTVMDAIGMHVMRAGNLIETGKGYDLLVVNSCLSARAIFQAWLVYFAVTRVVRPDDWRWSEVFDAALLAALVFLLNTGRLVVYALDFSLYEAFHSGDFNNLFGLAVLALALTVAAVGVRHECDFVRFRG